MSDLAAPSTAKLSTSLVGGGLAHRSRYLKDAGARWVVWIGGLGVIAALLLIFVYLVSQVVPLFAGASLSSRPEFKLPGDAGHTLYASAEEQGEMGLRVSASGEISFFDLHGGALNQRKQLPGAIAAVSEVAADRGLIAAQMADGGVLLVSHSYSVSYPNDKRVITPQLSFPYGEAPLAFLPAAAANLAVRESDGKLLLAATAGGNAVHLKLYERTESMLGDAAVGASGETSFVPPLNADQLLLEPQLGWLYVIDHKAGRIALYRLSGAETPQLVQTQDAGAGVVDASYLAGGISVVAAQSNGVVSQWFPARNGEGNWTLARVREFNVGSAAITALGVEQRRRTFAVGDEHGQVSLYYATSGRLLRREQVLDEPVAQLLFNPRAKYLMAIGRDGRTRGYDVSNPHPEFSFSALWSKVWYESYDEPKWLWQSSSASADFEPKFSFMPLSFGTLKAAFYAMIFAIPLAILAAIFTANFMSPGLRQVVKPTVELLAALPTVILGFLAGLWLAPLVESNLPGVFLVLLMLPLSIPLFGYAWMNVPVAVRQRVPAGWEAALLVPVIVLVLWLALLIAKPLEILIFGGNLQGWMDQNLGIGYDQRNALVVGIAMGVAVVPTIFSIAEDAIFGVPKQLSLGSMALGATPWQTLIGVVLPTASPGIFSAVMIGFGRAVGETMIVLMATGNTPVTNASLFSGMRTLSANIAVEMPESEVASTHYRLLFLAGLVLFLFTFFFNTVAEVVRQRLRTRYSAA